MRIGSLFSGAAGLDGAVQSVFGGEIAWHSEVDPAASKVLAYRFPDVPNLGDITKVDWAAVEPVDVLCGGFPCQDVSAAGRRAGIKDGTRSGLWSIFAEAIDAVRPAYVVVENVRGLLNAAAHRPVESEADALGDGDSEPVLRAIGAVLGDLSDLGYDAQWATVSAASVGAPHRRERVFILAEAADTEGIGRRILHPTNKRTADREVDALADHRVPAAFTSGDGWDEGRPESAGLVGGSDAAVSGDGPVELLPTPRASRGAATTETSYLLGGTRSDEGDLQGNVILHDISWGKYDPAIRRWESLTRPAPEPTEPNRNGSPRLAPAFSEWMLGCPAGWVTQVPGISRNDQLRIIGNGVVPQQAVAALRYLLSVAEVAA